MKNHRLAWSLVSVLVVTNVFTAVILGSHFQFRQLFASDAETDNGWDQLHPAVDQRGSWMWADPSANLAALVVTGVPTATWTNALQATESAVTIKWGPNGNDLYAHFYRSPNLRDRILIITPNGLSAWFPLAHGQAAALLSQARSNADKGEPIAAHVLPLLKADGASVNQSEILAKLGQGKAGF